MKIRSIREYVMRKQLTASMILIAAISVFSILALYMAIYFQTTSHAEENAEYIQLSVSRFFEEYIEQGETLNRSQAIRSYLAFRNQADSPVQPDDIALPSGVTLYDKDSQIFPETRYPQLLPANAAEQPFVSVLSEVQIGYFTPFYNFTGNEVLGYLCFVIPRSDFSQAIRQSVPETVSFVIQDSLGTEILNMLKNFQYQRENTVSLESLGLTCTATVDLESNYRSITLFLFCLIPVILLMLLASVWFSKRLSARLIQPINSLVASIKHNENGNLDYVHIYESDLEEIDQLSRSYQSMMQRIKELMDINQKENLLRMESQIGMLQEKINPHFLFNTLELISSQAIMEDAEQTAILTQKLGTLFRYNLRAPDVISLKRELQYVKDYLYLQNVRFNNLLHYEYLIDESQLDAVFPKLSIQPLLENCFKHGFADSSNQPHSIRLTIKEKDNMLVIRVDDDGCGMPEETQHTLDLALVQDNENFAHFIERREHIGLRNVNARLCMYFHISKALWFRKSDLGGTCIELCLPLNNST